jgi:hypothetical protein
MEYTINIDILNELLKDIKANDNIINRKFIKNMIKKRKILDYRIDEDGNITNEYAKSEIKKFIDQIKKSIPINLDYFILGKTNYEIKSAFLNVHFINSFVFYSICFEIYNYYTDKDVDLNNEDKVFSKLNANILNNYQGMLLSYLSSDYLTVIQKTRIIYEIFVIFKFIDKYKILVKPFLDHHLVIEQKIFKNILENKNIDLEEILKKYGEVFLEDYGWTKEILDKKEIRNLGHMAFDIGIKKEFDLIYKFTSNFIHTNSYSALKNNIDISIINTLLSIINTMLMEQTKMYVNFFCKDDKEKIFIIGLLNSLYNGAYVV